MEYVIMRKFYFDLNEESLADYFDGEYCPVFLPARLFPKTFGI